MRYLAVFVVLAVFATAYTQDVSCGNDENGEAIITAGPFPVADDCNMFYHCFDGIQYKATCGPGYSFDKTTKMCALSDDVQCWNQLLKYNYQDRHNDFCFRNFILNIHRVQFFLAFLVCCNIFFWPLWYTVVLALTSSYSLKMLFPYFNSEQLIIFSSFQIKFCTEMIDEYNETFSHKHCAVKYLPKSIIKH